jgi:hypothetical protein
MMPLTPTPEPKHSFRQSAVLGGFAVLITSGRSEAKGNGKQSEAEGNGKQERRPWR